MPVENVMEKIVQDVMMKHLKELKLTCECERCLADMKAQALNHLPPRYIVNQDNQPYIRAVHEVNQDEAIQVLKVVIQAATVISKNPHCDRFK